MGYSNTTMGVSFSSKPIMATRMEKFYYRRTSTTYDTTTHENPPSSPDVDIQIHPSLITTTYKTHS
jgi:hypothetical protein